MIPVTILTGFLGSGKTTLLGHLLKRPELARTAVVINEFGEIGLDHQLIAASEEQVIELETGCLCCVVRGDLALTLADLLRRRDEASIAPFERVVIETSGLADPAPILQLLMTDAELAARLTLANVVTAIDAELGASTLDRESLSTKQAAIADTLVLTKTDRTAGVPEELAGRLDQLNPTATRVIATFGDGASPALLSPPPRAADDPVRWLSLPPELQETPAGPLHGAIQSFAIEREAPIAAVALTLFLETLAEHCGRDLLRMKGLVAIAESPERPAVVHGVQHVFRPPEFLERWPSSDHRSRLVFIARGISRAWVASLLEAIECELIDTW